MTELEAGSEASEALGGCGLGGVGQGVVRMFAWGCMGSFGKMDSSVLLE